MYLKQCIVRRSDFILNCTGQMEFLILVHIDQILAFLFIVKSILMVVLYYLFNTGSFVGDKEVVSRLEGNVACNLSLSRCSRPLMQIHCIFFF
jgi:hypothetical protein